MKKGIDYIILNVVAYFYIGIIAVLCVLPFILLVSGSIQSEQSVIRHGYSLIPREIKPEAYVFIFRNPQKIIYSYGITVIITVIGTIAGLFISSMTAYVLSRKELKYRNALAFYLFFTTLFNAGLMPFYLLISNYLKLRNTLAILILSGMLNVIYIFIMRTYIMSSIPESICESAKMDAANGFYVFLKIVLPLMKPVIASIGLFTVLNYWNDWFTAMLFISNQRLYPLQYLLYRMLAFASYTQKMLSEGGFVTEMQFPQETMKLAMTVVATGPIILAYPFAQRYLISGMTIGAVKG